MIINEEHYNELMFLFNRYDTETELTLFWENGTILQGFSEIGYGETDTDIPEESPEYPGYYSAFLDSIRVINISKKDLEFDANLYNSLEIDMLNAPMLVKVGGEVVWEKEEDK